MRSDQMYAYTRPDGVVGFGFQIHPQPHTTHHSVAWPDLPCQRFTETMLTNQQITFVECTLPTTLDTANPASERLDVLVHKSSEPAVDSPEVISSINTAMNPETPPLQVAAEPKVTRLNDSGESSIDNGAPSQDRTPPNEPIASPGSESKPPEFMEPVTAQVAQETTGSDNASGEPLGNVIGAAKSNAPSDPSINSKLSVFYENAVKADVTTERSILHLIQKVGDASDTDIIRFLNGRGVDVSAEMVREQRGEAIRLEAQSGL